jgi:hypothetical protein
MNRRYLLVILFATACAADDVVVDDPADYIATPNGYYHKDCVHQVPDGTVIDDQFVTAPDGTRDALPICEHGHYASLADIGTLRSEVAQAPAGDGWQAAMIKTTGSFYREISASWAVPTAPTVQSNQIIFMFPGLETSKFRIVQPVLQWGSDGLDSGSGPYWAIAAWDCPPAGGGLCFNSAAARVNVGDVITGSAKGTNCTTAGVCDWSIKISDSKNHATEMKVHHESLKMTIAGVALETYSATCSEYPSSGAEAFDVTVTNSNGTTSTTPWSVWPGLKGSCGAHASAVGAGHTYLSWRTSGAP